MIDEMLNVCPFSGVQRDQFMAWDEAEQTYRVTPHAVNEAVIQLLFVPKLGLEHAAYRIETEDGASGFIRPRRFIIIWHRLIPFCSPPIISWALPVNTDAFKRPSCGLHDLDAKHRLAICVYNSITYGITPAWEQRP